MERVSLTLLGGFQVRLGPEPQTVPTRKAQALLAYLALHAGQAHSREKLATLLWGNSGETQARDSLRHALVHLRRTLAGGDTPVLLTDGQTVSLAPARVAVDVAGFERALGAGALEEAVSLYQGELLEGLPSSEAPFDDWLRSERARLHELAVDGCAKLLARQQSAGSPELAIRTALRLLALDPLQEAVHRTLMRLYVQQDRRSAALKQYETCAAVLRRELRVEPEPETRQLHREVLGVSTQSVPARAEEVWVGLAPRDLEAHEAPLIGREPEMGRLRAALAETAAGRGSAVTIVGEAGIGKSRLVDELAAEALHRGGRALLGRCYQSEQILALGAWVDALRSSRISTDLACLERLGPVWRAELSRLLPEVAAAADEGSSTPTTDYLRLFEAVTRLLGDLASRHPLLVVLEDLHWADEMSLRLLSYLARRASAPVLLVATAREEEVADSPALRRTIDEVHRQRGAISLTLPPLSQQAVASLVRSVTATQPSLPFESHLLEDVWAASGGNPLMALETLRTAQEGTVAAAWALEGSRPLPQRVQQVIAGRLDRLSERGRRLVAAAAVIGREFESGLLEDATGFDASDMADGLEELVRRRVLRETRAGFDFTHDRIREVAYGQLLAPRRKLLHGRVAKALETRYAGTLAPHYAALGTHARHAEAWSRAFFYLREAGSQAAARSAHREAALCFEQALDAGRHLPADRELVEQSIDLRIELRKSLFPLGKLARMDELLRGGEQLAAALGDRRRLARISAYMGHSSWAGGDTLRAIRVAEQGLAIAESLGDLSLETAASCFLGQGHHAHGDYRQAIAILDGTAARLEGELAHTFLGMTFPPAVHTRVFAAIALAEVGEFTEAQTRGEEARRIAGDLDDPYGLFHAWWGFGVTDLLKGDTERALTSLEQALSIAQARALPLMVNATLGYLGHAYARAGRLEEGTTALESALEQAVSMGFLCWHSLTTVFLADARLRAGSRTDAERVAREAVAVSRGRTHRGVEAHALRLLADSLARGDSSAALLAEATYEEALALAEHLGMRPLAAHCHLGLTVLYERGGRTGDALVERGRAKALLESMHMQAWT